MPKILIVEDDKNIASYLSTILMGAGYLCVAASAADRAQALLESEREIALVILDQNLGDGSHTGLDFLTALRQMPKYQNIPAIVCTGEARPAVLRSFLGLRITSFLKKPFRPERMLSEVQLALGHSGNVAAPAAALVSW
jgi:two-component system KDP operon response regulator KdpE